MYFFIGSEFSDRVPQNVKLRLNPAKADSPIVFRELHGCRFLRRNWRGHYSIKLTANSCIALCSSTNAVSISSARSNCYIEPNGNTPANADAKDSAKVEATSYAAAAPVELDLQPALRVSKTQSVFHSRAQRNGFRRRDARQ
jgi:hypothetical protein